MKNNNSSSAKRRSSSSINIFYLSYAHGFSQPHLHSQILPHIEKLTSQGVSFAVLTSEPLSPSIFEQERLEEAAQRLQQAKALWITFEKSGLWQALKKTIIMVHNLSKQTGIDVIHARGIASGFIAGLVKLILRKKFVYDPRIVYSDISVEQGKFRQNSLHYYLYKYIDVALSVWADAVRVESIQHKQWYLSNMPEYLRKKTRFIIDVNSVDTVKFRPMIKDRKKIREELGIAKDRLAIVYSGSILGKRNGKEMCDFVRGLSKDGTPAFFLILTHEDKMKVRHLLKSSGFDDDASEIINISYTQMPRYLSAADAAIVLHEASIWSFSFPLKFSEYLAVGLPVIVNRGFGGVAEFVERYRVGVVLENLSETEMVAGREKLVDLLSYDKNVSDRCRQMAIDLLSVEASVNRLHLLYKSLVENKG